MSGTSWIDAPKGKIAIYRERDYIYSMTGKAKYFVSDGWWYEIDGGAGKYCTQDNWVYTTSGKAAFPFGTANPELRLKATAPRNPLKSLKRASYPLVRTPLIRRESEVPARKVVRLALSPGEAHDVRLAGRLLSRLKPGVNAACRPGL